jgi:hypothetical protein
MKRLPEVIGLVLCERMGVDVIAGQTSLVGLFQNRLYWAFPTEPQRFTVFAALYGGEGEGTIELTCTRLETEQDVYRYQRWFIFPGRDAIANLELKVTRCVFPGPGLYSLTLRFDHDLLATRTLNVKLRGKSS